MRRKIPRQFVLFLIAGAISALLHWCVRIALSQWFDFQLAVALAYVVGIVVGFILFSTLVFEKSSKARAMQARDYLYLNVCMFPVVWVLSLGFHRALESLVSESMVEALAHALAISTPLVVTFFINKHIVFRDTR